MPDSDAHGLLRASDLLVDEVAISQALDRLASEISVRLCDANPVVLTVMTGAVVFAGQLLPRLAFPLDLDYVHVTRYGDKTAGGALEWLATPRVALAGRRVLLVDDILDEGVTLAALRKWVLEQGATECLCAVFADKDTGLSKPITADFVGVTVPNRYVFGFGMDVKGAWRNLPQVRALACD